jgi:hypothetical protein
MDKSKYRLGCKEEAAGSTSKRASPSLPIAALALAKASHRSTPFVSSCWLFSMESQKKPKQTAPM